MLRETSRTKRIADALVEHLLSTGELVLEQLVLGSLGLLPLTSKTLVRRNELRYAGDYDDAMFDLAHQFAEADEIVIAAPFWEGAYPALLKVYFEHISVVGHGESLYRSWSCWHVPGRQASLCYDAWWFCDR